MCGEKIRTARFFATAFGSPPRVRGEVIRPFSGRCRPGITPACAGRRVGRKLELLRLWDHPRVCGEKFRTSRRKKNVVGSPPRVRGEGSSLRQTLSRRRITPACAGRRPSRPRLQNIVLDHPRVCGEKNRYLQNIQQLPGSPPRARGEAAPQGGALCRGSPPRARGEVAGQRVHLDAPRITPACAGRSDGAIHFHGLCKDHPRVRGEKNSGRSPLLSTRGSPPRARGEAPTRRSRITAGWITPACAGRRLRARRIWAFLEDHPRVRGEKGPKMSMSPSWAGSPPRARGEVARLQHDRIDEGITPACAGRSCTGRCPRPRSKDHPRVRGEKLQRIL